MSWLAIALALVAAPLSLLDRRAACALLLVAVGLIALNHPKRPGVRIAAITCTTVATLITGWSIAEFARPTADHHIDERPYAREAVGSREVLLPVTINVDPITRLVLIELAADADPIYEGFEPQYVDRANEQGYRVIGYRHDGYVDIYEDLTLTANPDQRMQVTGKGKAGYSHTSLGKPRIERDAEGRLQVAMSFVDLTGRRIEINLAEATTRAAQRFNLHAPVGYGSIAPDFLPLFMLNDFDFMRSSGARMDVRIDGAQLALGKPLPVPIQGQRRGPVKATLDSEILQIFPTTTPAHVARTEPGSDVVVEAGTRYLFDGDKLERIRVGEHELVFTPALDLARSGAGRFAITSYPDRGHFAGAYQVAASRDQADLAITIDDVARPHHNDVSVRAFTGPILKFFELWPKSYEYHATINRQTGASTAKWTNLDPVR